MLLHSDEELSLASLPSPDEFWPAASSESRRSSGKDFVSKSSVCFTLYELRPEYAPPIFERNRFTSSLRIPAIA